MSHDALNAVSEPDIELCTVAKYSICSSDKNAVVERNKMYPYYPYEDYDYLQIINLLIDDSPPEKQFMIICLIGRNH